MVFAVVEDKKVNPFEFCFKRVEAAMAHQIVDDEVDRSVQTHSEPRAPDKL